MLRTWVEIDGDKLAKNLSGLYAEVRRPFWLMLKSNAYGHGAALCLKAAESAAAGKKVIGYGVSCGKEAVALRKLTSKRIAVFGDSSDVNLALLKKNDIEFALFSLKDLERLAESGAEGVKVQLKLETGLNRYGFRERAVKKLLSGVERSGVAVVGVYSHFSAVEEGYLRSAEKQLKNFVYLADLIDPKRRFKRHIAASAAALLFPESRQDEVRIGISFYGLYPSAGVKKKTAVKLFPALSWKTVVAEVHKIKKGEVVGYGNTFKAKKNLIAAVIPVGYADGYDRGLSNKGEVLIHGVRCQVLGRVFMNTMVVDVSFIRGVKKGEEVVLIGRQGAEEITAEELAAKSGTINYEIVTRINWEIPRVPPKKS